MIDKLLGGRPMTLVKFLFTDVVSGESVGVYEDKFGRMWMATGRWAWFRVPRPNTEE